MKTFGGSLSPRPFIYISDFIDMSQGMLWQERGVGNDPEPLGVAFLQPFIYINDFIDIKSFQLLIPEIRNFASLTNYLKLKSWSVKLVN